MTEPQSQNDYVFKGITDAITVLEDKQVQEWDAVNIAIELLKKLQKEIQSSPCNEQAIRREAQEEIMDKFGILHGEAAAAFNEYLNDSEPIKTPEAREIVRKALEQAQRSVSTERLIQDAVLSELRLQNAELKRQLQDVVTKESSQEKVLDLTDKEFWHLALRLHDCGCDTCKIISRKIYEQRKLRQQERERG